ncbi:hypothetical protein AURDEDRAFT_175260 [Auricularia subglabra TFB-10046 SS5]|nr:hypothetical protein AURDEDRAFT_175260 [Auricularia subglabra TFB-10046 SS5]
MDVHPAHLAGRIKPTVRTKDTHMQQLHQHQHQHQHQHKQQQQERSHRSYDQAALDRGSVPRGGRPRSPNALHTRLQAPPHAPAGRASSGALHGQPDEPGSGRRRKRGGRGRKKHNGGALRKTATTPGRSLATEPQQQQEAGPSSWGASSSVHARAPSPAEYPITEFVSPPPDLMSSLLDGPSRKRKRDEDDSSHQRQSKRPRWEDVLDTDTLVWVEGLRQMASDVLQRNGTLQLKTEGLLREIERLYEIVAEERWRIRLLEGLESDDLNAKNKFLSDEIHRLRHPAPRDESKRLDMYGDTDLSDADDSDDMNVRSELDEDEEYTYGNGEHLGYEAWNRRNNERNRRAGPSRSRVSPRAGASAPSRPQSRTASPSMWLHSPLRAPSPGGRTSRAPASRVGATPTASSSQREHGSRAYHGSVLGTPTAAVPRKDQRIEHAASMDEVEVVGTTINVSDDFAAPDLNDADTDHALAAAEHDQQAADSRAGNDLETLSLDEILTVVPRANPRVALREAVWNFMDGFRTPMPLGRYGHPYRQNWAWGSIDPRRIFKETSNGSKLPKSSSEFRQLAREAVMLPFAGRSLTQRVVVGWAHRDGILPMKGWYTEPDVVHEARSNPAKITSAVRRRNTVNRKKCILYTEWDLVDLDCNILMRMSRPRQPVRELKVQSGKDWNKIVWKALEYGWAKRRVATAISDREDDDEGEVFAGFDAVHEYDHGPQPYDGDGSAEDVFLHLRRCGFGLTRLVGKRHCARLKEAEMGAYLTRLNTLEQRRQALVDELCAKSNCGPQDLDIDVKKSFLSANVEYEDIPEGRSILCTCTKLARAHKYYFGNDGVLRYMEKNVVTGLESKYSPEEIVRIKEQEQTVRNIAAYKERFAGRM